MILRTNMIVLWVQVRFPLVTFAMMVFAIGVGELLCRHDGPEIALQHCPLERIVNPVLRMGSHEIIQSPQRPLVRGFGQQILRVVPKRRIKRIWNQLCGGKVFADKERGVQLVPRVRGIGIVNGYAAIEAS